MSGSTHRYERRVIARKDELHAKLLAWQRREGKSRAEFADTLSRLTGQPVTESKLRNWIERGATQRRMPQEMEYYFNAITRQVPKSAGRELNRAEFEAFEETG